MQNLLYTSGEVRQAITHIFETSHRRKVAISAFVGEGAGVYLRKPKDVELFCWPKAGSTNPNEIRKLIKEGACVFFADSLHMKVYWTEDQGSIISSANLSTSALGSGNLKEIGILLKPGELDIDRVIRYLKPRAVSEPELKKLDRAHNAYISKNPPSFKSSRIQSFKEWYESPWRCEWKIALITGHCETASIVKETLQKEYHISKKRSDYDLISAPKGSYLKNEWILVCEHKNRPIKINWLYADFVADIPKSDKKAYDPVNNCQIVQAHSRKYYSGFPFNEHDKQFKKAFLAALQEYGPSRIEKLKSCKPPLRFLNLIFEYPQRKPSPEGKRTPETDAKSAKNTEEEIESSSKKSGWRWAIRKYPSSKAVETRLKEGDISKNYRNFLLRLKRYWEKRE